MVVRGSEDGMNFGRNPRSELASEGDVVRRRPRPREKPTVGVPLVELIKRKLRVGPEIVMVSQPRSMAAERFRRLKTVLVNEEGGGPGVLVVTSAGPGEGKSTISLNLALAFAGDPGASVLLIDGDLRRPRIDRWLAPAPRFGLAELLQEEVEPAHVILSLEGTDLKVIPAGAPPREPSELLSSDHAKTLIDSLRRRFQRIIIDTPPIVPFTDADAIGAASDGVLLVARCGRTRRVLLEQALASVTSTRIVGTVLNETVATLADRGSYDDYSSYYGYYSREPREP